MRRKILYSYTYNKSLKQIVLVYNYLGFKRAIKVDPRSTLIMKEIKVDLGLSQDISKKIKCYY